MTRYLQLARVDEVLDMLALEALDNDDSHAAKMLRDKATEMWHAMNEEGADQFFSLALDRSGEAQFREIGDAKVTDAYLNLVQVRVYPAHVALEAVRVETLFSHNDEYWVHELEGWKFCEL